MTNGNSDPYPIQFYNSLTRKKESFSPVDPQDVRIYTCGPTVYHYVHIGNLRTFLFEDILRRTLKYFGYGLTQVMNLTDVDDKTIRGAIRDKVTLEQFTKPFIAAFFDDLKTLHVQPAEHYPAATDYITQMIQMIEGLIKKGVAYLGTDGSVYFSIEKFPHYGCLSHLKLHELKVGASDQAGNIEGDDEDAESGKIQYMFACPKVHGVPAFTIHDEERYPLAPDTSGAVTKVYWRRVKQVCLERN